MDKVNRISVANTTNDMEVFFFIFCSLAKIYNIIKRAPL